MGSRVSETIKPVFSIVQFNSLFLMFSFTFNSVSIYFQFQVSTIDGTHNLHMEKPDAVCRVMETFLTEVAAGNSKL